MSEALRLAVVIVNYRTADLVIDCLASLHEPGAMPASTHVMVVDGGSADGSAARIGAAMAAHGWLERASLLALDVNGGFAYGNNRGLEQVYELRGESDYVLFLNPDTVVQKDALRELVAFMDRTPDAGIAGSRLEDPDGTPQTCAFRFPNAVAELESEAHLGLITRLTTRWHAVIQPGGSPLAVDWVSGASMIMRSAALRDVGAFDEDFFLYYEELDLCLRAANAGWRCYHVPASRVVHLVGRSTGVTTRDVVLSRRPAYWFASRQRYFLKHHGALYLKLVDAAWVLGHLIARAKGAVKKQKSEAPPHILGDFLRHSIQGGRPSGARS